MGWITDCPTYPVCVDDTEPPVRITGFIRPGRIRLRVYPEKRIPRTDWWSTYIDVLLENCSTNDTRSYNNLHTNQQGETIIEIPANDPLPSGNYNFYIKGISHLRRKYDCYSVNTYESFLDFTLAPPDLLAGEVDPTIDNYINSLDMSYLLRNIYTNDYQADLNQDSEVNSLDFSNQLYNIFIAGD